MSKKKKYNSMVLIIDDNPKNIQAVGNHLKAIGIDIAIATNGKKGLDIAKSRMPDLILLDIMMPDMGGYQVCEILKEDTATEKIPVIFLTAKVNKEDILQGFNLGAVDYIQKPFNAAELIARVKTHLKLKLYRDRIEEVNKKLKQADSEKNEILSIAAHDLKNPIYSISMLAKVIRDETDLERAEIEEFSHDIITTSDRMLELIKNLLDLNAIEQGKAKIIPEDFKVAELICSMSDIYRERAAEKNIRLNVVNNTEDIVLRADRSATLQVIDNLVSNAIKFSPHDRNIYINIRDAGEFGIIEVKDEGPGLTEEDKKKLFGKFERLSAQPTGNENSTGLGLSIVKKYIDSMNGKISCESSPGKGAAFIVELPKAAAE